MFDFKIKAKKPRTLKEYTYCKRKQLKKHAKNASKTKMPKKAGRVHFLKLIKVASVPCNEVLSKDSLTLSIDGVIFFRIVGKYRYFICVPFLHNKRFPILNHSFLNFLSFPKSSDAIFQKLLSIFI